MDLPESQITTDQWKQIATRSAASYPSEACGIFIGRSWDDAELVLMENMQDRYHERDPQRYSRTSRTAYTMNSLQLMNAIERGGGLLAIWHSHCDVGAYFSDEDVKVALGGGQEPLWPGTAYLVVSCRNKEIDAAKWFEWDAVSKQFAGRDVAVRANGV